MKRKRKVRMLYDNLKEAKEALKFHKEELKDAISCLDYEKNEVRCCRNAVKDMEIEVKILKRKEKEGKKKFHCKECGYDDCLVSQLPSLAGIKHCPSCGK